MGPLDDIPQSVQLSVPDESREKTNTRTMLVSRHPAYNETDLRRYRLTYQRNDEFIQIYLRKHYEEDPNAWKDRQALTYNPAFAAEAVDEYVRALVQRSPDINRVGGSKEYLELMDGHYRGIDRQGSTMNAFMSKHVIPELLSMGAVAVYIDNDILTGETLADTQGRYPYAFTYRAEDILNWRYDPANPNELLAVLLRDYVEEVDAFQLCKGIKTQYRHVMREADGRIIVRTFDQTGKILTTTSQRTEFPVVISRLPHSLLKVTSRYQIAMLNVASSDLYYAWASNFPIYTEQYDQLGMNRLKETRTERQDQPIPIGPSGMPITDDDPSITQAIIDEMNALPPGPATGDAAKIKVGTMHGRLYPLGAERPGFVHPSSDPLRISMEKEAQLKAEMRQLTALAVTQLEPMRQASSESKKMDNLGLEAGMAFIAQELELTENKISAVWHSYRRDFAGKSTRVKYPEKYNLKTDEDRRLEAEQLTKLHQAVPSRTFHDEVSKMIVETLFKDKVTTTVLDKMKSEIVEAPGPTADPDVLQADHEGGAVSDETYSLLRGYKPGEHIQAAKDNIARLEAVAKAQSVAAVVPRGTPEDDQNQVSRLDKKNKPQRGTEKVHPKGEE